MRKQAATVKTSLEFDRDLWFRFRSLLLREGKTATSVIEQFIAKWVEQHERRAS